MSKISPINKAVGPLLGHHNAPDSSTIRGDLIKADDAQNGMHHDKKPSSPVAYISFGSFVYLKQDQWDEIAYGLLNSGVSFLWLLGESKRYGKSGTMESSREGFISPINCMFFDHLWVELFYGAYFEALSLREHGQLCPENVPEVYHFDRTTSVIAMRLFTTFRFSIVLPLSINVMVMIEVSIALKVIACPVYSDLRDDGEFEN
ncbi:hypothetical protein DKX38_025040 [Salix brachista]|uniref:Uncharacterized protein n=1 Tax=Salix brachista TaxID=2182728 RepID=A0A5N5JMX6_9ROSI|nr:hypothetical protein DKX38_025040 [Salix brachista]